MKRKRLTSGLMVSRFLRLLRSITIISVASIIFWSIPLKATGQGGGMQIWQVVDSSDRGIEIVFSSPGYEILPAGSPGDDFDQITMTGSQTSADVSKPAIPVYSALVGVPPGVDLSLQILHDDQELLPGFYHLAAAPAPQLDQEMIGFVDNTPAGFSAQFVPEDSQPGTGVFPGIPAQLSQEAWLRDQRIVRISVYPFQYNQSSASLTWHRSLRLLIRFSNRPTDPGRFRAAETESPFERELEHSLLNYQSARLWRRLPGAQINLSSDKNSDVDAANATTSSSKYRISIKEDGLYRLSYETLAQAGLPGPALDFRQLNFSNQGRLVTPFAEDHNQDHIFGPGDAIVFYGQRFYGDWMANRYVNENANWLTYNTQLSNGAWSPWKPAMNAEMLEKYTDENVYWLDFTGTSQPALTEPAEKQSASEITFNMPIYLPWISRNTDMASFRHTVHVEPNVLSRFLLFNGEDTWYWDEIKNPDPDLKPPPPQTIRTYSISLPDPILNQSQAKLSGEIAATSSNESASPDHHIKIYINDSQHLDPVLDASWDGKSRYHFEANFPQSKLINGNNQIDLVVYLTPNLYTEDLYLDWLQVDYNRKFVAVDNEITINSSSPGIQTVRIRGLSGSDIGVYEITNPLQPSKITQYDYNGSDLRFTTLSAAGSRYYIGKADPISAGSVSLKNLIDFNTPANYVFITPASLVTALQPLVDHRAVQGYSTLVVDLDQLYNQYNDGIINPIAIKNFLAYTFTNWQTPPTYVLLVGDGHWNYKNAPGYGAAPNLMPPFLSWVDPWQGEVDSANLLAAVVGNDSLADVMIGRLPVNSVQELSSVISKTIAYEQVGQQPWKNRLLFVADNTTTNPPEDFVAPSERIISGHVPPGYIIDRIYLDSYIPSVCAANQTCSPATQAVINSLNQNGAFFLNYTGHGSINLWASEQIFSSQNVASLNNNSKLPVMLSMTCLDGYWIHPITGPSLAEEMLRASNRGAVASFSPTGLGLATGHETLQAGFYDALFKNGATRLGQAVTEAKLALFTTGYNYDLLHTFTIFGDPALRLITP